MKYRNLILAGAVAFAATSAHSHEVRLCVFPHSPTRGVDTAVAKAAFGRLALSYREVDLGSALGDGALAQPRLAKLLASNCDVFAGIPTAAGASPGAGLVASQPYAATNFVEFGLPGAAAGGAVAVAYRTPAQLIAAEAKVPDFDVENTPDAVIRAVVDRRVPHGIAWAPSLQAYQRAHPGVHFAQQATHSRFSTWQLRFVGATRESALLGRLSHAIDALRRSGELQRLTAAAAPRGTADRAEAAARPMRTAFHRQAGWGFVRVAATPTAQFSAAQVGPGRKVYAAECARCHGAKLEGRTAPALVGAGFAPASNSTMTVGGIYQYVTTNMPADKPGQLKPDQYLDVMAFLLHANGYAPSGKPLTARAAPNDTSPFDSFVQ
ncbi:hypothetical protein GALL_284520 [mine drainage metagenome]|uniref:Cytochrome c domain-containing protein n=1 Tax=mine drainage metagenome TaxID=410659 RepID=A0A1J5R155_9ZZZZ